MSESNEEKERRLDARYEQRVAALAEARAKTEGFEVVAYEPIEGDLCHYRLHRKVRGRWKHAPCEEKPLVTLTFQGPRNPKGSEVPLCRRCVARVIRDLLGCIDS